MANSFLVSRERDRPWSDLSLPSACKEVACCRAKRVKTGAGVKTKRLCWICQTWPKAVSFQEAARDSAGGRGFCSFCCVLLDAAGESCATLAEENWRGYLVGMLLPPSTLLES